VLTHHLSNPYNDVPPTHPRSLRKAAAFTLSQSLLAPLDALNGDEDEKNEKCLHVSEFRVSFLPICAGLKWHVGLSPSSWRLERDPPDSRVPVAAGPYPATVSDFLESYKRLFEWIGSLIGGPREKQTA
jgi:hypothetical protein